MDAILACFGLPDPPKVTPGRGRPLQHFSAAADECNGKTLWADKFGKPRVKASQTCFFVVELPGIFSVYLDSTERAETAFSLA